MYTNGRHIPLLPRISQWPWCKFDCKKRFASGLNLRIVMKAREPWGELWKGSPDVQEVVLAVVVTCVLVSSEESLPLFKVRILHFPTLGQFFKRFSWGSLGGFRFREMRSSLHWATASGPQVTLDLFEAPLEKDDGGWFCNSCKKLLLCC